jgi:hypothetical protein
MIQVRVRPDDDVEVTISGGQESAKLTDDHAIRPPIDQDAFIRRRPQQCRIPLSYIKKIQRRIRGHAMPQHTNTPRTTKHEKKYEEFFVHKKPP